jgi:hypothetical protein
LSLD